MPVFMMIVGLAFALFWCYEFINLVTMDDALFPGKYDKLLWGLAFVLVMAFAPFAFWYWRRTVSLERTQPEPDAGAEQP